MLPERALFWCDESSRSTRWASMSGCGDRVNQTSISKKKKSIPWSTRNLLTSNLVFCTLAVHAHLHLLAIPKQHLQNISVLGPEHIPLLQQLKAAGTEALREILANEVDEATGRRIRTPAEVEEEARNNFVFNFHVPPFNSIDHLHLHCLHLPSHGWLSGLKYNPTCCPVPWSCSCDDVLTKLQ